MSDDRPRRPTHLTIENVEKGVTVLRGDVAEMRDEVAQMNQILAGHEVRFDNGRKVMGDIKGDVEKLKPRAPDWQKMLLAGFSIVALLMGAQLWITEALNDRPTHRDLERRLAPLETAQKEMNREIRDLTEAQTKSTEKLKTIQESIGTLLERTQPTPPRKRR